MDVIPDFIKRSQSHVADISSAYVGALDVRTAWYYGAGRVITTTGRDSWRQTLKVLKSGAAGRRQKAVVADDKVGRSNEDKRQSWRENCDQSERDVGYC